MFEQITGCKYYVSTKKIYRSNFRKQEDGNYTATI